ncbi:coiled-coil domain-containing protein [Streptomyces misionensis]|uniref:hypothetical protein n=1 Tax=Streptomyces misionensis TaxID=67331 RepID=UPI00369B0E63
MNTKRVNAAADVIARAVESGYVTPTGWASALESAQLLQSPERAAEFERLKAERDEFCDRVDTLTAVAKGNKRHVAALVVQLQNMQRERDAAMARVAALEAERHSTNEALNDAVQELRARREMPTSRPLPDRDIRCGCGHDGAEHQHAGARCWAQLPRELGQPVRVCPCEEFRPVSVVESAARLVRYLAPEGEHYAAVHHDYRVSHDLPPLGGVS